MVSAFLVIPTQMTLGRLGVGKAPTPPIVIANFGTPVMHSSTISLTYLREGSGISPKKYRVIWIFSGSTSFNDADVLVSALCISVSFETMSFSSISMATNVRIIGAHPSIKSKIVLCSRGCRQMGRILGMVAVILMVLLCVNVAGVVQIGGDKQLGIRVFPPTENITFGIYIGGTQEVPRDNFSILIDEIRGYGFNIENITSLSSLGDLKGVDILVLLTQKDLSESERNVIKNYTLMGGSIFCILPQEITDDVKDLLRIFGWEPMGIVRDNESFYENDSYVILSETWPNISVMRGVERILVINATALNYTGEVRLLKDFGLNQTFKLDNETEIPIIYNNKLLWGMNTTYTEPEKGKKIYGENITIGFVQEYWFGGRIIVISSAYIFENTYVVKRDYDNLAFLDNLILWLGNQLSYIGIEVLERSPAGVRINIDEYKTLNVTFALSITNTTLEESGNNLTVLVGLQCLGELRYVKSIEPTSPRYDDEKHIATYRLRASIPISDILNKSMVVYLRIIASKPFYGFHWNKAIRIEAEKPHYKPMPFHPVLLFIAAIVAVNTISIILVTSYALKRKKEARLPT